MESPGTKRLRQAQLPFLILNKVSPSSIKNAKKLNGTENKENVNSTPKISGLKKPNQQKNVEKTLEPMVVDLTEDSCDSADVKMPDNSSEKKVPMQTTNIIDQVIDEVVKRAEKFAFSSPTKFIANGDGNETLSAKKRRRRSMSPVNPEAKRVLCEENGVAKSPSITKRDTPSKPSGNLPRIVVTAATPIAEENMKKTLNSYFTKLAKGVSSASETDNPEKQPKSNPIVDMVTSNKRSVKSHSDGEELVEDVERKARSTEKSSKYPPLSCVLGRKRPRSKSPNHSTSPKEKAKNDTKEQSTQDSKDGCTAKKPKEEVTEPAAKEDCHRDDEPEVINVEAIKDECQTAAVEEKAEVVSAVQSTSAVPDSTTPQKEKSDEKDTSVVSASESPPSVSKKSSEDTNSTTPSPPQDGEKKKVTPKSGSKSQRSLQAQLKREAKEKEREEKKKQREEQKIAKEKEKQDMLKKKEEEKAKKEEEKAKKEEERRKKKEEEEAAKAERLRKIEEKKREKEKQELEKKIERERKEEEKRKEKERKEEEKKQKELEKQKIEKEKQQAEEEKKRKNEKRAETFKSFFKSPTRSPSVKKPIDSVGIFVPFQPKKDMMVAPVVRAKINSQQKGELDRALESQDMKSTYIKEINFKPRKTASPTMPSFRRKLVSLAEDGLELIEADEDSKPGAKFLHAKYLYFHTNYRPPYYGTWRKESQVLSYRNPFKMDKEVFDYEFDSDDEWEEPVEGEDIANSDGEDEGDNNNEEDEDDGFFVPHGYLSDDEGINEEGEDDNIKTDHKLKQKQLEFEASFKRKLSHLTPIVIGCIWKDTAESINKVHQDMLSAYKAEFFQTTPIDVQSRSNSPETVQESPDEKSKTDSTKKQQRSRCVPEEAIPDLIRLLHGNPISISSIINEFRVYWELKKMNPQQTTYGPMSLEDPPIAEDEKMDTDEDIPLYSNGNGVSSSSLTPAKPAPSDAINTTPKTDDMTYQISKTQLTKKCKEIASYVKKDNMNRSCWFVNDDTREAYDMKSAPVPCKWSYVTDVPKIQILIFPQVAKKLGAVAPSAPIQKQTSGSNIAKFAEKLCPKLILERCKNRHEKEKTSVASTMSPSISKFTTEKISPHRIIEKSAQRIAEDIEKAKIAKEQEAERATANKPPPASQIQEGTYMIPTPDAMRSLFRMDAEGVVDLTDNASNSGK